jgi:hypothetical protein
MVYYIVIVVVRSVKSLGVRTIIVLMVPEFIAVLICVNPFIMDPLVWCHVLSSNSHALR